MLIKCTNFDKHAWEGLLFNLALKAGMDTYMKVVRGDNKQVNVLFTVRIGT